MKERTKSKILATGDAVPLPLTTKKEEKLTKEV
jgi:hypothetical protein